MRIATTEEVAAIVQRYRPLLGYASPLLERILDSCIPVIPDIDAAILDAIRAPGCKLDMDKWHTCKTMHCRAGWAVTLAGDTDRVLEQRFGTCTAAVLIYLASRPGKLVPNFYASNEDTMRDLELCAAGG